MKKVMIVLLCGISALLSCAFAFNQKMSENEEMANFNSNENSIQLHIQSLDMDKENLLSVFNDLKDTYNVTIIRTDYLIEDEEQVIQKAGIYSENYFENSNIDLYSGRFPKKENEFIASFETGDSNQVGIIRDLFEDQKMIVKPMEDAFLNKGLTVNGEYTIEFQNLENINTVKKELSQMIGVDESSLFDGGFGSASGKGTTYLIVLILIVAISAIFALTNVFYPITKLKEIGVMKLLGFTNRKIWHELNSSIVIIPIIFTIISICLQVLIIPQAKIAYFLKLSVYLFMTIFASILLSLIMLVIIKKLKVSQILKKFFNFKISLYSSYILKFLVFFGLIFAIPYMVQEVKRYVDESSLRDIYEEQADYLTLAEFDFINNEINGFMGAGEDTLGLKLIAMFDELEDTAQAEYISTMDINPNAPENKEYYKKIGTFNEEQYIFSIVNENYLKRIDYHFERPIDDYFSDNLTVLIPTRYKSKDIEKLVKDQVVSIYFSDYVDKYDEWDKLPISIEYYKDNNKKIFSERLDRADIDKGYISDPIFVCQSTKFLNEKNSLIANSAITNPIRIYDSAENRDAINKAVINQHLENNNLEFTNMLNSGFAEQIAISQSSTYIWFGIIVLALLVSVLSSYYISIIILVSKKQLMLVSRLLGHSFFERYKNEIFYFIGIYVFGLLELLILSRNWTAMLFYLIIVLIDILIVYCLVKKHDTVSLTTALKGEE